MIKTAGLTGTCELWFGGLPVNIGKLKKEMGELDFVFIYHSFCFYSCAILISSSVFMFIFLFHSFVLIPSYFTFISIYTRAHISCVSEGRGHAYHVAEGHACIYCAFQKGVDMIPMCS